MPRYVIMSADEDGAYDVLGGGSFHSPDIASDWAARYHEITGDETWVLDTDDGQVVVSHG